MHACCHTPVQIMYEIEVAVEAMRPGAPLGPLRDHRPLQCNADDWERMASVPNEKDACFRHMPGVVSNEDGTCCAGHYHAYKLKKGQRGPRAEEPDSDDEEAALDNLAGCLGGGTAFAPARSMHRSSRVDHHDKVGWRGNMLEGCASSAYWLPSGDLLCPRWCITYKSGKSGTGKDGGGRQSCFGRVWYDEVQPTVVTRAEPHNLRIVHPEQDRTLSVRENQRCQGFPDYWVLVGLSSGQRISTGSVPARYTQVGNAVAPPMARKLGLCLLTALLKPFEYEGTSSGTPVIRVPDPEMDEAYAEAKRLGLKSVSEEDGTDAMLLELRLAKAERDAFRAEAERLALADMLAKVIGNAKRSADLLGSTAPVQHDTL